MHSPSPAKCFSCHAHCISSKCSPVMHFVCISLHLQRLYDRTSNDWMTNNWMTIDWTTNDWTTINWTTIDWTTIDWTTNDWRTKTNATEGLTTERLIWTTNIQKIRQFNIIGKICLLNVERDKTSKIKKFWESEEILEINIIQKNPPVHWGSSGSKHHVGGGYPYIGLG